VREGEIEEADQRDRVVKLERLAPGVAVKENRILAVQHVVDVQQFFDVVAGHVARHIVQVIEAQVRAQRKDGDDGHGRPRELDAQRIELECAGTGREPR